MKKWIAYGVFICLVLALVPLLLISHYNVPLGDDFVHTIDTFHVWRDTNNVGILLKEAWLYTKNLYINWQGRWVETFIVALTPITFRPQLNFVGPYISLFMFVTSQLFFSYVLFKKVLKGKKYDWFLIGASIIILQLLLICSPSEGIYWNAGAVSYTWGYAFGFYSISIFLYLNFHVKKIHILLKSFLSFLLIVCCIVYTGCNFVVSLPFIVITFLLFLGTVFIQKKNRIISSIWFLSSCVNFLVVVLAPGNSERSTHVIGYSPLKSILVSYEEGAKYLCYYLGLPTILLFLFLVPLLWKLVEKISFSFRYPLAAIFIAYSVFVSSLVPCYYAFGDLAPGPWRVQNIWKHFSFWLILFVLIYFIGWLQKQVCMRVEIKELTRWKQVVFVCFIFCSMGWSLYVLGPFEKLSSVSAYYSIRNKEAQSYYQEWLQCVEILEDDTIKNAEIPHFVEPPYVLDYYDSRMKEDLEGTSEIAKFYNKESIRFQK